MNEHMATLPAAPRVVGLSIPPGTFRVPRVVVAVLVSPLVVRVTVRRLSGRRLELTPAGTVEGGMPGVSMPPPLWEAVRGAVLAAVHGDDAASAALQSRPTKRHRGDGGM